MLKKNKINILYLLGVSMLIFLASCVDTNVQPIPSKFDFRSEVKVVNFTDGSATFTLKSNQNNGADVNFPQSALGDESPASGQTFQDIPSGAKDLIISSGGASFTAKFVADTDRKMRLFVFGDATNGYTIVKSVQRYVWQTKSSKNNSALFPVDSAEVSFINGSPDATVSGIEVAGGGLDTSITLGTLKTGDGHGYMKFKKGSYTVNVISGSDTLNTFSLTLASQERKTAAVYDTKANIKSKVFIDD